MNDKSVLMNGIYGEKSIQRLVPQKLSRLCVRRLLDTPNTKADHSYVIGEL